MNRVLLSLAFVLAVSGTAAARPWQPSDLFATGWIDSVEAASNGEVLFNLVRPDTKQDSFDTRYFVRDAQGKLRPIAASSDIVEAHWAPNASTIAIAAVDRAGTVQLSLVDPKTGTTRALSTGQRSIRQFAWSPRGDAIAAIEVSSRKNAQPPLSFWFDPNNDVLAGTPPVRELWVIDPRTGKQRRLVSDSYSYGGPATDHDPNWSADGTRVAVVRQPTSLYASFEEQEFVSVDVATGAVRRLTDSGIFALPGTSAPAFGSKNEVATVHTWDNTFAAREDVFIDNRDVTAALDRDFWSCGNSRMQWDGDTLLATAMDGTSMRLYRIAADGNPTPVTPAGGSVEAFSAQPDGSAIIAYSTPETPFELYRVEKSGGLTQLTHVNPLPQGVDIAKTAAVTWKNAGGRDLTGQLTQQSAGGAILITELHGGPQCADDSSFNPFIQYFATNGYAYFRPSPRGSDGYGDWSYKAIIGDWGPGPMDDVMRGVDSLVQARHFDRSRLFLYGASYGGYLTSWVLGHTTMFHAAVAAIPVTDLTLDYTLSESPNITRRFFGKRPLVENPALLAEQSPLRYADQVRTPVMLIAGLRDTRAPYPQTIEYYKILQERGNDVRLLAYPKAGHGPSDPNGILDWNEHIAGWFHAHGGPPIAGEIDP